MMVARQNYQGEGIRLSELLDGIVTTTSAPGLLDDVFVLGLSADSRRIGPGDLFLACGGFSSNGHEYIDDAIKYGACAVLFESSVMKDCLYEGRSVPVIGVDGLAEKVGLLANSFYNMPSKELVVTGVTGTNGKTSCCHIIAQALSKAMSTPAGILGTLGYGLCGDLERASHTTPDPITVHRQLRDMKKRGAKDVVMEVSSHGLDQGRIIGVEVDVAVFTNISRDHLDYHSSMQAYVDAKKKLFALPSLKCAVINLDNTYSGEMMRALPFSCERIAYSLSPRCDVRLDADLRIDAGVYGSIVKQSMAGSEVLLESDWGSATFTTPLLGDFNVSNLLAALSVLLWRGVKFDEALARLSTVRPIAGRMEVIASSPDVPTVVVDYAHTPDALEKALKAIRQLSTGQLWCVFGCGGDRDQGKRAEMGRIAELFADQVVLTDDNPRLESPEAIARAVLAGVKEPARLQVIHSRQAAIEHAVLEASSDDVVLIAGKGHEDYQDIGGERRFFSDHAVVLGLVSQRQSS